MDEAKRERLWDEARRRCRLSPEAVRMAKEMGLNPRSLIKNIPSPSESWKAPVEDWVRDIYAKRMKGDKRNRSVSMSRVGTGAPREPARSWPRC